MIRRFLMAAIFAAAWVSAATAASNETLKVCAGVEARSPMAGAAIEVGRPTFRWTAEPVGTAKREIILVTLPAGTTETLAVDKPYRLHNGKPIKSGGYTWFVVFYDSKGTALCRSPLVSFTAVGAKPGHVVADASILGPGFTSGPASASTVATVVIVNNRWVVVLQGSPYLGPRDVDMAGDVYISPGLPAGKIGVEVHGNDNLNFIVGSTGDDLIYGYGGNDTLDGNLGNDIIYGGAGNDTIDGNFGNDIVYGGAGVDAISDLAPGDSDEIYGGPDGDSLSVADGDTNDTLHYDPGDIPTTDSLALEGSPGDASP